MINYGVLLLWSAVLISEGITFFKNSFQIREVDEMVLAHPVYPVKFLIIIGAALIFLQGFAFFVVSLKTYCKGEKYEP